MRLKPNPGLLFLLLLCIGRPAHASIGLVVGEPFGSFGTMMSQGHASIYLDHLCPETPTTLRMCRYGEHGTVVSRQHDLHHPDLDWLAVPASTFFYSVDDPGDVPSFVTRHQIEEIREKYRRQHLSAVVPDRVDRHGKLQPPPYGDWYESIGAAFDRRLLLYVMDTTAAQDAAILTQMNDTPNHRRYTLGRANCADFAADLLSVVLPGVLHRNVLADFDMTTPKHLARQIDQYGQIHPELHLQVFEIPQIPGTARRSRPLRGAAEMFVKTKRYLVAVLILQPELLLADWIIYEKKGKWTPGLDAIRITPREWFGQVSTANIPAPPEVSAADAEE